MHCPSCGAYGVSGPVCYYCGTALAVEDDRRSAQARLEEKPGYRGRAWYENRRSWAIAIVGGLLVFLRVMRIVYFGF